MFHFIQNKTIALLCLALINIIIVFTYVDFIHYEVGGSVSSPRVHTQDTPSYVNAMYYMEDLPTGTDIGTYLQRMLTVPLMLLSSIALGTVTGDYAGAMLLINLGIYFASVFVFYSIGYLVFQNTRTALIGAVLYTTNWCLFSFGTTYQADMGGWFFFLLTTLFALKYYRDPETKKWLYLGLLSSVIGVFFKEYGALGMSSVVLLTLIAKLPFKQKIQEVVLVSGIFLAVLFTYHLWFYFHFDFTYFDWYTYNQESYGVEGATSTQMYTLASFIKVVALIFFAGWPIFLYGLTHLYKKFRERSFEEIQILLALLPASAAFLMWPAFTWRVAFILVPWAALVAAYGLSHIASRRIILSILVFYILFNYHTDAIMWNIDLPF